MITAEATIVYRAGGRRYLTLRGAASAAAKAKVRKKCTCDYVDHDGYGREDLPCRYHDGSDQAEKILRRLSRLYLRAYRANERSKP